MRQDYIEPDYVNGVEDSNGNVVIRPLNAQEKKFLNDFYEETINANFMHDDVLKDLYNEMKVIRDKEKNGKGLTQEEIDRYDNLQIQYFARADDVLLYSNEKDQKKLYGENNARNRCIYNRKKAAGQLDEFNIETMDGDVDQDLICPETGRNLAIDTHERERKYLLRKKKEQD
jgi:hypothetical protein